MQFVQIQKSKFQFVSAAVSKIHSRTAATK